MSSRILTVASREPVSFAFCCLSLVGLIFILVLPSMLPYLGLFPEYVTERGYLWALVSYAVLPGNLMHFLLVSISVLWVGWYIEPVLGRLRHLALLASAALSSGAMYVLLSPTPAAPLIGGLFVAAPLSWRLLSGLYLIAPISASGSKCYGLWLHAGSHTHCGRALRIFLPYMSLHGQ
jgi:membrane associated rhomboid family serine protease